MLKISIIGCGKIGKPMKEAFEEMGYEVIGIDKEPKLGKTDYYEISNTKITFIIVPTPSELDGSFSNKYIYEALEECKRVFGEKNQLIVISSTVMPGSMTEFSKRYPQFDFCYNPFFIRLPSMKEDILDPKFILIGCESDRITKRMTDFYLKWEKPIWQTNFVNAEIGKMAVSTFMTTKISFFNSLARLCEKIKGADIDEVSEAIYGFYEETIKAGARYGGPCLPRDNKALRKCAEEYGVDLSIAKAADEVNDEITRRVVDIILKKKAKKVLIMGMTYTLGTYVTEESQGVVLAEELAKKGIEVFISDPFIDKEKNDWQIDADVIVIANQNEEFKELALENIKKDALIIDCWRILKDKKFKNYIALGINE